MPLTPQKRVERLKKIEEEGIIGVLKIVDGIEEKLEESNKKIEELSHIDATVVRGKQGVQGEKGDKGDKGEPGRDGIDGIDGVNGRDGKDGKNGRDGKDGKDGKNGENGTDGNIKELSPDEVRNLLELLPEGEKLKQDAIEGLTKALEESKKGSTNIYGGGVSRKTLDQAITSLSGARCELMVAISDETTAITTGTAKLTFRMPYAMTLTSVRANLNTASSSGNPAFDINEGGVSIFSTTLTIDANEKTSTTAATPAVLSDTSLADDAEITIDIDTAGTGAKGAKITFIGTRV